MPQRSFQLNFRWTCRLRDALERRGFWASNEDCEALSGLREVELSGPVIQRVDSILFPRDFGWDDFVQSIQCHREGQMVLYRNRRHLDPRTHRRIENRQRYVDQSYRGVEGQNVADCYRKNIHVLWLSQDVFISSINFHLAEPAAAPLVLWDYHMGLFQRAGGISHYAYLLSRFQDERVPALERLASRLPLDFIGQLTTPLPAS
jgi:hypothetical protein